VNSEYVVDTMALVLRLERRKLGRKIKTIFEKAEMGRMSLFIPAMVLAEIGYLSERNKKNLELITNDPMIIDSKYVSTIW